MSAAIKIRTCLGWEEYLWKNGALLRLADQEEENWNLLNRCLGEPDMTLDALVLSAYRQSDSLRQ